MGHNFYSNNAWLCGILSEIKPLRRFSVLRQKSSNDIIGVGSLKSIISRLKAALRTGLDPSII
jgi:hypothetical protein